MTRSTFRFLTILAIVLSGCSNLPAPTQSQNKPTPGAILGSSSISTLTPSPAQQSLGEDFLGRVVDMDGKPIAGAQIESLNNTTTSDKEGWFQFPSAGLSQWIKVTSPGFISRTRAAAPGVPVLFRLSLDDGKTVVLHFAGDTMFGRRFFDPNGDNFIEDALLPPEPTVDDHMKLLAPVQPLLEDADLTVLNLETTLNDPAYFSTTEARPATFHPTTASVYASHPSSVVALKQAGVDIVDIGNNHIYDMLEPGLNTSLSALDQTGLLHFGAGTDEASAWAPVVVSSKGQTIAFIGCTTLRIPLLTPTTNDIPYVASDVLRKGGAAYCAEARLRSEIIKARQQANIVVVMIHGGQEYDPAPTNKISFLSEAARQAGAALVINHQPHVIGGFSWRDPSLIAWTMGSFLSDQTVWPALESYMLSVYLRDGKVIRAYVEPLMLDSFVPHGVTAELADYVVREAAGQESGPFVMESGAMEVDFDGRALQKTYTASIDAGSAPGQIIPIPQAEWVSGFNGTGRLLLGRDLLWIGGFENDVVSASNVLPLWDLQTGNPQIGKDYGYEGTTGLRLTRGASNTGDAVTTNVHRVLIDPHADLSITGMVRLNQGVVAQLQLSWYSATSGPSFKKTTQPIEVQADGTWQPFRLDIQAPQGAVAVGLFLRLRPPDKGTASADFDNIRIIQWASRNASYSPLYNYALLIGSGELTFTQQVLPGGERWLTDPSEQQIK